MYFGVRCVVTTPSGTQRDLEDTLFITVLDEDDNPPVPQFEGNVIDVRIKDGEPLKVGFLMLVIFINYIMLSQQL